MPHRRGRRARSWSVEPDETRRVRRRAARSIDSGTTARASATASALRTWLPCPPASRRRTRPSASRMGRSSTSRSATTRRNARRPGAFETGSSSVPRSVSRNSRRWPASRRIAGRTNSSNVTKPLTGLPGSPNRTPPSVARPNANGLPGWTATRHRSTLPMASKAILTTSYGPTDTPPATITASASSRPCRIRVRTSSRSSRAIPRSTTSAPAATTIARRPGPFASGIPAGPSGSPGARTSSPVARTAIRGRRWTATASAPLPAAMATRGRRHVGSCGQDRVAGSKVLAATADRVPLPHRLVDRAARRQGTGRSAASRADGGPVRG